MRTIVSPGGWRQDCETKVYIMHLIGSDVGAFAAPFVNWSIDMSDLPDDAQEQSLPLPPPTFEFFVLSLKAQTEVALGLLHFGDEKDRPKPDLLIARHTIDLLAMIAEKTRGNLSIEEQRLIENSLTELRFRFVQVSEAKPAGGTE